MPVVEVTTEIAAPPQVVFDLARDIDLHVASMRRHGERAVAGRTSGLIGPNEEVTWRARHLGVPFRVTSRITAFDAPLSFTDSMVSGPFARFEHEHRFDRRGERTVMNDRFDYEAPFGPLGRLADRLFLERAVRRLLERRAEAIKEVAETAAG
ncbi:MAG: SRPBCC family protein [Actinomycetota bacterium]|nr:SRPBCC family protein [Actinomycetota bacterium]